MDSAGLSRKLDDGARRFAAGDLTGAARAYREAERLAPDDLRAGYSLAIIDIREGRLARARTRLETVVRREPQHAMAQHNLGAVAQQLGDWEAAARAYAAAIAARPDAAATREALAIALAILGRVDEAVGQHRELACEPDRRWAALTRIALLDPSAIAEAELEAMRGAAAQASVDAETRAGLCFAIGEVLDRRGQPAQAFEAFAEGNRLKRGLINAPGAARANAQAAERMQARMTADFLAAHEGRGDRTAQPIFIVGFPRSGSTLIEQVLAIHPQVQGLGETGVLPELLAQAYPAGPRLPAAQLKDLGQRYLAAMRARGWDGRRRFVDKTLENYLHVGMIHLMFPRARIVESVRDPMDAGLSAFRQLFASGNETLYDLADIGAEYRRYRALMDHWREVLPGRVVETPYEALVADPEPEIRVLLARLGLPWDPAVLRFHERGGAVRTASSVQVRRPMSTASVGAWRALADQLRPLIAALGPLGPSPNGGSGASDGT